MKFIDELINFNENFKGQSSTNFEILRIFKAKTLDSKISIFLRKQFQNSIIFVIFRKWCLSLENIKFF